jgi:hypothetical protein
MGFLNTLRNILSNCISGGSDKTKRTGLISDRVNTHNDQLKDFSFADKGIQILLQLRYRELLQKQLPLPTFEDAEFRAFSQNGEDGILLYIFSLIGMTSRKAVEICAGDGIECNTANLIINHGWTALLFDAHAESVARGKAFYAQNKDTFNWPPQLIQAWVTAENVNELIQRNGFEEDVDLLSLDMDGMDYWIWKAIQVISPRVVVVEYQDIWGPDKAVTVPYDPDFVAEFGPYGPDYCGASLPAFVKLGRQKGYRLVGCQRYGYNAFFIRNGIADQIFPEIPASACFKHPKVRFGIDHRLPNVIHKHWVEV